MHNSSLSIAVLTHITALQWLKKIVRRQLAYFVVVTRLFTCFYSIYIILISFILFIIISRSSSTITIVTIITIITIIAITIRVLSLSRTALVPCLQLSAMDLRLNGSRESLQTTCSGWCEPKLVTPGRS